MYTNIEVAKQLAEEYKKVTIKELEKFFEEYPTGEDIMHEITGFGSQLTCILCHPKHEPVCENCIWYSLFPVDDCYPCTEHETYQNIECATDALELKQALLDRAELLEEAIYEAEQENIKECK